MKISEHYIFQFPEVKGIFVGGCVDRGEGSRFRAKAHSHVKGKHKGYICVLSIKRLSCTALMLHEAAHIITGLGHVDKWRKKLLEIGGTLDPVMESDGKKVLLKSYQKKVLAQAEPRRGGK